ncbi:hypothetical protein RFI_34476 [Reticulomyxa filosa]|uniref:Uncharacterized protein n=1 Tax=Reticulomyxa filosa TaxID=46433 RepID=X6LP82_RETFI|nr:hypothetical protein RFI_34476 [Reticulomyxa filosa]|eukprot:ETO02937.1 hypothetical protein RFI_34476 [Reticulomyxa filosa]
MKTKSIMFGIFVLASQNLVIKEELADTETLFRSLRIEHKVEGPLANDEFGRRNKEDKQNSKRHKFRNLILYKSSPHNLRTTSAANTNTQHLEPPHHSITTVAKVNTGAMCLSGIIVFILFLKKILNKKNKCDIMTLYVCTCIASRENGNNDNQLPLQKDGKHFLQYFNIVYVCLFICCLTYNNN